jgi:hypothetical protein
MVLFTDLDFQRTILFFGAPKAEGSDENDWKMFNKLSELVKKPDAVLNLYLNSLIALSKETVAYYEKESKKINEDGSNFSMDVISNTGNPNYPKGLDGETLTLDRAKKVIKRIAMFEKLREKILKSEHVLLNIYRS